MQVKRCATCPYTPRDLAIMTEAALHLCAMFDVNMTRARPRGDGHAQSRQSASAARPSCTLRSLRRKVWSHSLLSLPHRAVFNEVRRALQGPSGERQPLVVAISSRLTAEEITQ